MSRGYTACLSAKEEAKAIKEEKAMSDKIKEDLSEALKDFKRTFNA